MKLNNQVTLLSVMSLMLLMGGAYFWYIAQSGDGPFTDDEAMVFLAFSVTTWITAIGFGVEAVRRSLS
jgi:hypothetical protein